MLQMMAVFALPPKEGCKMRVSLLSLYGMWPPVDNNAGQYHSMYPAFTIDAVCTHSWNSSTDHATLHPHNESAQVVALYEQSALHEQQQQCASRADGCMSFRTATQYAHLELVPLH